jgi:Holliday junction resolvase RusA-like endonuclease
MHWSGKPLEGCIELTVIFVLPRPQIKIWKRKPMPRERHGRKPDIDNLLKSLKDALTGLLWRDDRQISDVHAHKRMAAGNEAPHVDVVVKQVETYDAAKGN